MSSPIFNPPSPTYDPILPDVCFFNEHCPLNPDTENPVHEFVMKTIFTSPPPPNSPDSSPRGSRPFPFPSTEPGLPPPLFIFEPVVLPPPVIFQEERCKHCNIREFKATQLPVDPRVTEIASPLLSDSSSIKDESNTEVSSPKSATEQVATEESRPEKKDSDTEE
ncbi:MAG: hypothetical protein ACI9S8_000553 [Chlamydiales bacterium]|jgi:hypothetical protein